jgi:hypothetical protein
MEKKIVIAVSIIVLLVGAIFLMMWRSHVMGPGGRLTAGGLMAVSAQGTPLPVPIAQAKAGDPPENTARQESGGLIVSLTLNPYPPSVSKASDFEISLTDANGQAVSDATISLDLTMPGMYMPPNLLTLEQKGEGKYNATGRFTMRGLWQMEAIITINGNKQSVFFDVWL